MTFSPEEIEAEAKRVRAERKKKMEAKESLDKDPDA